MALYGRELAENCHWADYAAIVVLLHNVGFIESKYTKNFIIQTIGVAMTTFQ